MRFCSNDGRLLERIVEGDTLRFSCPSCGEPYESTPEDALVYRKPSNKEDAGLIFQGIIRSAAQDRVNARVKKECPACGLDYMTLIRIGEEEKVIFKCKCGETI